MKNSCYLKMFIITCIWMSLCAPVFAADEGSPGLEFSVRAVLPDNQRNQEHTYFDLKMDTSQKQTVEVEIENLTDRELKIETQIHTATTNRNGVVEHGESDILPDDTLPYQIEELVTCDSPVMVPANQSVMLEIHIQMPEEEYEGMIAGGITFQLAGNEEPESGDDDASLAVRNTYSYVIGMVLAESEKELQPELVLNDVSYGESDGSSALSANIQNIVAAYVDDLEIEARITRKGTKGTLYQESKENMRMAPNSNFDFPIDLNGNSLNEGEFTLYITAKTAKKEWNWEKDFVIDPGAAYSDKTKVYEEKTGYLWLFAVVTGIFLLSGMIVYRYKRMLKARKNCKKIIMKDI